MARDAAYRFLTCDVLRTWSPHLQCGPYKQMEDPFPPLSCPSVIDINGFHKNRHAGPWGPQASVGKRNLWSRGKLFNKNQWLTDTDIECVCVRMRATNHLCWLCFPTVFIFFTCWEETETGNKISEIRVSPKHKFLKFYIRLLFLKIIFLKNFKTREVHAPWTLAENLMAFDRWFYGSSYGTSKFLASFNLGKVLFKRGKMEGELLWLQPILGDHFSSENGVMQWG